MDSLQRESYKSSRPSWVISLHKRRGLSISGITIHSNYSLQSSSTSKSIEIDKPNPFTVSQSRNIEFSYKTI